MVPVGLRVGAGLVKAGWAAAAGDIREDGISRCRFEVLASEFGGLRAVGRGGKFKED